MPRKRRSYPAELKAKVALEALREEATMAELAAAYGNRPDHTAPFTYTPGGPPRSSSTSSTACRSIKMTWYGSAIGRITAFKSSRKTGHS